MQLERWRSSAAAAGKPDDVAVRAALKAILQQPVCADSQLAAPPVLPESQRSRNWRARRIVKEIEAITSLDALCEYEAELRATLVSQEVRQWVKLTTRTLFHECNLEEVALLEKEELAARHAIEDSAAKTISPLMHACAFMVEEERMRMAIVLEYRSTVRWRGRLFRSLTLAAKETASRRSLAQQAELERDELLQRRLIDLGQGLQRELTRRNASGLFIESMRYASDFGKSVSELVAAEGRDRVGIEKLSFLHLSVLYTQAQENMFAVLRQDVMTASALRTTTQAGIIQKGRLPGEMAAMMGQEARLRDMIVAGEQAELHAVLYHLTIGWRDVHQRIVAHSDIAHLVASLELFERRAIHDEERYGRHTIEDVAAAAHRLVSSHQRQRTELLAEFSRGAAQLWQEEHTAHAAMHRWHHVTSSTAKAISAEKVLVAEEERSRVRIRGEEVRAALSVRRQMTRERCQTDALDGARALAHLEKASWDALLAWHYRRTVAVPLMVLSSSEAQTRARIELEEDVAAIDLRGQKEELMTRASILVEAEQVVHHERHWRQVVVAQEATARRGLLMARLTHEERSARHQCMRQESASRRQLQSASLLLSELGERWHREAEATEALHYLYQEELVARETRQRQHLSTMEAERRNFIFSSTHYQYPFLRACAWEELEARLALMAEAELAVRACAYRYGHDAPIRYSTEELCEAERKLRFFSLGEVYATTTRDLLATTEPQARQDIECEWERGFSRAKLMFEEGTGRHRVAEAATDRLKMLHRHCRDGERLLSGFAPRLPTGDLLRDDTYNGRLWSEDRILAYLREEERRVGKATLAATAAVRAAAREGPARLFVDMFLLRDRLVFEEFSSRRSLGRLCRGTTETVPSADVQSGGHPVACLEVHSALTITSRPSGSESKDEEPVALVVAFSPLTDCIPSGASASGGELGSERPNQALAHHCALAKEHVTTLLSAGTVEVTASIFSTSRIDRRWRFAPECLLRDSLSVRIVNRHGVPLLQGACRLTPADLLDGFVIMDFSNASSQARVKLLLNV